MKVCSSCNVEKEDGEFRAQKGRNTTRSNCKSCDTARHSEWRKGKREHLRQYDRARWKKTDRWNGHIKSKYGIDAAEYDAMLAAQNGGCAICETKTAGGKSIRFHVDHCHASGKVRGLLCMACNRMLGLAKDRPETLLAAAQYLNAEQAATFVQAVMDVLDDERTAA